MDQAPLLESDATLSALSCVEVDAQRMIACLLLANLSSRVLAWEAALQHVSNAYDIAKNLSRQVHTLRTTSPIKVLKLSITHTCLRDELILPILGDALVVPSFHLQATDAALRGLLMQASSASTCDMTLAYLEVRLRTARAADALEGLMHPSASQRIDEVTDAILRGSLRAAGLEVSPLDVADDYVSLALNLVRERNVTLAGSMLWKADLLLSDYVKHTAKAAESRHVSGMRKQISSIIKGLNSATS